MNEKKCNKMQFTVTKLELNSELILFEIKWTKNKCNKMQFTVTKLELNSELILFEIKWTKKNVTKCNLLLQS